MSIGRREAFLRYVGLAMQMVCWCYDGNKEKRQIFTCRSRMRGSLVTQVQPRIARTFIEKKPES